MAGSYNGPDMWGGGSTWWEQVTGTSHESSAIYRANREASSFYIPLPGTGAGVSAVGEAATGGPGAGRVGSAPTGGPGVVRVGAPVGGGAGNRLVKVGQPDGGVPWFFPKVEPWFEIGETTPELAKDQDKRTGYKQFGITIQPAPWFTDAEHFENRSGDDGPGSWLNQMATQSADYAYTYMKAFEGVRQDAAKGNASHPLAKVYGGEIRAANPVKDWLDYNNSQPLPTFPSAGYGW